MRALFYQILIFLLAAATVGLALKHRSLKKQFAMDKFESRTVQKNEFLPQITVQTLDGHHLKIAPDSGRLYQVIFLFNTTCEICRASISEANKVKQLLAPNRLSMHGLSLDSLSVTKAYRSKVGLDLDVGVLTSTRYQRLYKAFFVPQTFLIGPNGQILYSHFGKLVARAFADSVVLAIHQAETRQLGNSSVRANP